MDVPEKIRPDEAFALLRKWEEEFTPLRVYVSLTGCGADFDCRISGISGTLVTLQLKNSPIAPWFELKNCLFTYGDPPRPLSAQPSLTSRKHVSALLVKSFSGGWNLALVEHLT